MPREHFVDGYPYPNVKYKERTDTQRRINAEIIPAILLQSTPASCTCWQGAGLSNDAASHLWYRKRERILRSEDESHA